MAVSVEALQRPSSNLVPETSVRTPLGPLVFDIPRQQTHVDQGVKEAMNFEDTCMQYLINTLPPTSIIVGPGLIDSEFGRHKDDSKKGIVDPSSDPWLGQGLPDAMIFNLIGNNYMLTELIEMRAGSRLHAPERVRQFSNLINLFRKNPEELHIPLVRLLKEHDIPKLIVPEYDEEIEIHFVRPHPSETFIELQTEMRVFYWTPN